MDAMGSSRCDRRQAGLLGLVLAGWALGAAGCGGVDADDDSPTQVGTAALGELACATETPCPSNSCGTVAVTVANCGTTVSEVPSSNASYGTTACPDQLV